MLMPGLQANVLLNISGNAETLGPIIDELPFLVWVHSIHAGIDHIICPSLGNSDLVVTNAKGVFSSTLAEYVIGMRPQHTNCACSYLKRILHCRSVLSLFLQTD